MSTWGKRPFKPEPEMDACDTNQTLQENQIQAGTAVNKMDRVSMLGIACRGVTHIVYFFFKQHILSAIWILWRFNFICRIS